MTSRPALSSATASMTASASGPARTTGPTRSGPAAAGSPDSTTAIAGLLPGSPRARRGSSQDRAGTLADQHLAVRNAHVVAPQAGGPRVDALAGAQVELPLVGAAGEHAALQRPEGQRRALVRARPVVGVVLAVQPDQQDLPAVQLVGLHLAVPQVVRARDGAKAGVSHGTARPATAAGPGQARRASWPAG